MRRLAQSAERVRRNIKAREQIPDYTHRRDEIGHLSGALRDMTNALYVRMDAIESFAADVSHELKNPLTSLRNAAGMLPYVKSENDRNKLLDIIQHDVRRLDRLITDISDASRLDAELARETGRAVNVAHLLDTLCKITNDTRCGSKHAVILRIEGNTPGVAAASGSAWGDYVIHGHDSRLSQVISNLLDNALSFSPPGGKIHVAARLLPKTREVEILVEDEGPGIRPENLERIFDRFYTDRPEHEAFGQNSGLGLHISRQIVQAHGGRIWAENRSSPAFGSNRRKRRGMQHMPQFQSSFSRHGAARNGDLALLEPEVSEGERHGFGARFVIRLPSGPASRR
jgi:two-component system sensor histidine kinase ChvG